MKIACLRTATGESLMSIKIHTSFAIHVGEWLKSEIVEAHGVSINDLAAAFGVSRTFHGEQDEVSQPK